MSWTFLLVALIFGAVLSAAAQERRKEGGTPDGTPPDQLLLKDYRPESIYKIPEHFPQKSRFPIVDVHSHAYARTVEQVDQWVRTMDEVGVARTVVLTGATGKAFDDLVALYGRHPKRFELWCGIDYAGYDQPGYAQRAIAELGRCAKAGARGVGELSDKGRGLARSGASALHIDDPRLAPVLDRCGELGLPINIHVGEDMWMYEPMDSRNDGLMNSFTWRIPEGPAVLRHDDVVATLERAVRAHPHTTFIACHFANCCSNLSMLARMLDSCPNLYADIAARYAETAPIPRYMAKFYDRYQDRLLYGTDMGFRAEMYRTTFRILETEDEHFYDRRLFSYHWPLQGIGLKNRILRKLYAGNARKILTNARPLRTHATR